MTALLPLLPLDWSTLALLITLSVTLFIWWTSSRPRSTAPGPKGLPIFGDLFNMCKLLPFYFNVDMVVFTICTSKTTYAEQNKS